MLTFVTTPKPFIGHIGNIQKNAMRSWAALRPSCDIIVFGDEEGSADIASEIGARHVLETDRNQWGTPLLNRLLDLARAHSPHDYICYVNADIILTEGFLRAATTIMAWRNEFLMVGRRTTIEVKGQLDLQRPDWQERLRSQAASEGQLESAHAIDFFFFHRNCFVSVPPFAIGRFAWDNWLIYSAVSRGIPVVDITKRFTVLHQNHDYSHVAKDKVSLWNSEEAATNRSLAGGPGHLLTLDDASYRLDGDTIRRNLSLLRLRRAFARRVKAVAPGTLQALRRFSPA